MTISASTVRLRPATPADLSQLLDLLEPFNASEGIVWHRAAVSPALERLIGNRSLGAVGLIEAGAETAGCFVVTWGFDLEWAGRDAFLTELYLVPAFRGQGVGKQALAQIEALARAEGAAALHLMVRPENVAAVGLYAQAGFRSPPRTLLSKELRPSSAGPGGR